MDKNTDLESFKKQYSYDAATPMMQQFLEIKFQHLDCLLLFRMGDFYELFFEDALKASKILGIALAKRGKHAGSDLAMCGVPHHSLESYLLKLLDYGAKVAICEQRETPEEAKKRGGYKAVVKREVVRIITPGTVLEDSILDSRQPNYLAAINIDRQVKRASIAVVDLSTSYIAIINCPIAELTSQIVKLDPKEVLISDKWQYNEQINSLLGSYHQRIMFQVDSIFALNKNSTIIKGFYKLQSLESIGSVDDTSIISLGVILQYIITTQKQNSPALSLPQILNNDDYLFIDAATRKSLEITTNIHGKYNGSLFSIINHCCTKHGSRLLYQFLSSPLKNIDKLNRRLEFTQWFKDRAELTHDLREILRQVSDLERILAKIATNRALPSDLLAIATIISIARNIKASITQASADDAPALLQEIDATITSFDDIYQLITSAINPEAPNNLAQVGVILGSYHPKIAELNILINQSSVIITELQENYRKITGVDSLKITKNNVLGYFIEVTAKNAAKVTQDEFTHRQSTQNAVRFSTERLSQLEAEITQAHQQLLALEHEIWQDVSMQILQQQPALIKLAYALSQIDVFTNFAFIAEEYNYHRPELQANGYKFDVTDGRHAVVEHFLNKQHEDFTANNCTLSDDELIWLLTGPNMAGKSTFLRQNALIIILAQIGSFVPATKAEIAIVDKLFSRIGASDDLAQGQSTFMVEMIETAAILNQSTAQSFVILDEVGRGTSTYDGMSIAWAILEFLHDKLSCRSLFATHYHELTALSDKLPRLANYSSLIDDANGKLLFLHKIVKGSADKSYGLHVAELAGLPQSLLNRAAEILNELEASPATNAHQLSLTPVSKQPIQPVKEKIIYQQLPSKLDALVNDINPDNLTPKQALELLYKIKAESDLERN